MGTLSGVFDFALGWPAITALLAIFAGLAARKYFRNSPKVLNNLHAQTGDGSEVTQIGKINE